MSKPRLCEILEVEVDQGFIVKGFGGGDLYHINKNGNLLDKYNHFADIPALCHAIEYPDDIIRRNLWTEKDKTDARAARQLFGDCVTAVERGGTHAYLRTPTETIATLPDSAFPSVRAGDSIDIDEILEDET